MDYAVHRILAIIFGLLLLFGGRILYFKIIGLLGFAVGATIGALIANSAGLGTVLGIIVVLLAGLLGLGFFKHSKVMALIILGGFLGYLCYDLIPPEYFIANDLVMKLGAIVFGVLIAFIMRTLIVIVATAVGGAIVLLCGVYGQMPAGILTHYQQAYAYVAILAVLGSIVQLSTSRRLSKA